MCMDLVHDFNLSIDGMASLRDGDCFGIVSSLLTFETIVKIE